MLASVTKLDAIARGARSFQVGDEVLCAPEGVTRWRRIVRIVPEGRHARLYLEAGLFESQPAYADWLLLSLLLIGQAEIR